MLSNSYSFQSTFSTHSIKNSNDSRPVDQRYHKNFGLNVISLMPILSVNEESARKTCSRHFLIMAQNWKTDETLKCDLEKYVSQNLQRREIINFMERDYPFYVGASLPLIGD